MVKSLVREQQSHDQTTVNSLKKDFMQIINLKQHTNEYLLCEIDPSSVLYQPIESLRKLLLKESDSEPDYDSLPPKNKDRSQMEIYIDSVEQ